MKISRKGAKKLSRFLSKSAKNFKVLALSGIVKFAIVFFFFSCDLHLDNWLGNKIKFITESLNECSALYHLDLGCTSTFVEKQN
jgi:hypothetical protein